MVLSLTNESDEQMKHRRTGNITSHSSSHLTDIQKLIGAKTAKAEIVKTDDTVEGILHVNGANGPVDISIDDFQALYTAMTRIWPVVTTARAEYHTAKRALEVEQARLARLH
jgi:hypothetical protein